MKLKCIWLFNRNPVLDLRAAVINTPPPLRVSLPSVPTPPPLFSLPQEILGKIIEKQEPEQGQKWPEVAKDHLYNPGRQAEDQAASCLPGKSLGLAGNTVPKFIGPKGDLETHLQIRGLFPRKAYQKQRNTNHKGKRRLWFPLLAHLDMTGNPLTPLPSLPTLHSSIGSNNLTT